MKKIGNLTAALQNATADHGSGPIKIDTLPQTKSSMPPSREGKRAITGFFDPAVSRQLKQIGLDENRTIQDLLREALNDFFEKYHRSRIA